MGVNEYTPDPILESDVPIEKTGINIVAYQGQVGVFRAGLSPSFDPDSLGCAGEVLLECAAGCGSERRMGFLQENLNPQSDMGRRRNPSISVK